MGNRVVRYIFLELENFSNSVITCDKSETCDFVNCSFLFLNVFQEAFNNETAFATTFTRTFKNYIECS